MDSAISRRRRVLLIAEAANPEAVSVPLVGWSLANALRRVADVHIVTQIRNRAAFLRAGLVEEVDFTAIDSERIARPLHQVSTILRMGSNKGWTTVAAIRSVSYAYFEHLVWKQFGARISCGTYDIVHRITPITPTAKSSIAVKCRRVGVPFVLGPINGGVPWPRGFEAERRREREWLSYVRGIYRFLPGTRATLGASSAILVGSRHTQSEIPDRHQDLTIYLPENGIDPDRFFLRATPGSSLGPLKVCFVGRLVPYKGPDMLIEAAAELLDEGAVELDIVGDGPMMSLLKEMAGSRAGVRFHGWLEHREVQKVLASSDLLGFPSIREFGGGVVLEAMALGVPPLVVDYAGPGELVSEGRGFKVPIGTRQSIVVAYRKALAELVEHRERLGAVGAGARAWVASTMTWEKKAERVAEVYDQVLSAGRDATGRL